MPQSGQQINSQYRPDIDGLRAVAVLSVVLFHLGFDSPSGGFVGVDVFFVISGFLITRLILAEVLAGDFSYSRFYIRRARRLFPALFATLALTFVFGAWLLSPSQLESLGRTSIFSLLSVSNIQFWSEIGYFNPDAEFNPLLHTWSLAVEEQFYLIWPLSLVLLAKAGRKWLMPVVALVAVLGLVASEWQLRTSETAAFYLLPFRIFELAIGALMVWVADSRPREKWLLEPLAVSGLALIIYPAFTYSALTPFPGVNALMPCLGAALLIYAGEARWVGSVLRNRMAVGIGLISYSLYLVHWPMIVIYGIWKFDPLGDHERWGLFAASLALALVFYRFVEKPYRRPLVGAEALAKPGSLPARHPNVPFLGGAALLVALLVAPSASVWATKGWPWRFNNSDEIETLLSGAKRSRIAPIEIADPALRVAVIGDSHIVAHPGLAEWGQARKVEFVRFRSAGGCPPLYGVNVFGRPNQTETCAQIKDIELEKIAAGNFDAVILVARWGLYTGEVTPADRIRPRLLDNKGERNKRTPERSRQVFVQGLRRTVELMARSGTPVLFVGQVPPLGSNPYDCVARQSTWRDVERQCIAASYEEMKGEAGWATDAAVLESRNDHRLTVFDPFTEFCADGVCRMTADGQMLYRDSNHLNQIGSRRLAGVLGPLVVAIARLEREHPTRERNE